MSDTSTMTNEQREQIRLARNKYLREWRKRNPDKVQAQQERYWMRKVEREEQTAKEGG